MRQPDELDRSLRDPDTLPEGARWTAPPHSRRVRVHVLGTTLQVTIGPPRDAFLTLVGTIVALGMAGLLCWLLAATSVSLESSAGELVFVAALALPPVVFLYRGLSMVRRDLWRVEHVKIWPDGMCRTRVNGDPADTSIPVEDIEALDVVDSGRTVQVLTDNRVLPLGLRLRPEESAWLRDAIHLTIAGIPVPTDLSLGE